ncbi:pathogenesis-related protein 1 [Marchantia polymorpha subsp. ruderalis]
MDFGLRPRFLIHILVISLIASSIINVAQGQFTADEYLTPHNVARAGLNQGIPSLIWDTTLESYATNWAATRAAAGDNCALIPSGGPYGENIVWSPGPSTPADAVQTMVSGQAYYDYATNSCTAAEGLLCGGYVQVVWRNTTALGCGSATCPSGALFFVCSYYPRAQPGQRPY